jgi:hypothetical protein
MTPTALLELKEIVVFSSFGKIGADRAFNIFPVYCIFQYIGKYFN